VNESEEERGNLLLGEARVDDVNDSVDGDGGFGDVGGDDDFSGSGRRSLKDLFLLILWERTVKRKTDQRTDIRESEGLIRDTTTSVFNLLFSGEEEKNIAFGFELMDLEDGSNGGLDVISLWFW